MKIVAKTLIAIAIIAPTVPMITVQTASADNSTLHQMQRHCAKLGRNVGVNPSGEYRCGSVKALSGAVANSGDKSKLSKKLKLAPQAKK